jgi:hypothetical protein
VVKQSSNATEKWARQWGSWNNVEC